MDSAGTFTNDENEAAPEGGLQTRPYARAARPLRRGGRTPTLGRPNSYAGAAKPLRRGGQTPTLGRPNPYAGAAKPLRQSAKGYSQRNSETVTTAAAVLLRSDGAC